MRNRDDDKKKKEVDPSNNTFSPFDYPMLSFTTNGKKEYSK